MPDNGVHFISYKPILQKCMLTKERKLYIISVQFHPHTITNLYDLTDTHRGNIERKTVIINSEPAILCRSFPGPCKRLRRTAFCYQQKGPSKPIMEEYERQHNFVQHGVKVQKFNVIDQKSLSCFGSIFSLQLLCIFLSFSAFLVVTQRSRRCKNNLTEQIS